MDRLSQGFLDTVYREEGYENVQRIRSQVERLGCTGSASDIDKELNKMFLNTLKAPYYDRMIGNSNTNFSDVVFVGEMIENGVKLDKIESTKAKKPTPKKKEGETHAMSY